MSAELEIGHVLFVDIVEYSKLANEEQSEALYQLNRIVRETAQFRATEANDKLICIPTGDGMALIFFDSGEAPANCAWQISEAARSDSRMRLRMGIHSGPVNRAQDVNDRSNVTGAGINMAQRVMDCGDAGHILLSKRAADDLAPLQRWQRHLHEIGEIEVKHGIRIPLVNLFTDKLGNPELPSKLKREAQERAAVVSRRRKKLVAFIGVALAVVAVGGFFLLQRALAKKLEKSIAVLPFENLSPEKENAYFAGGIQDQVLTNLAKIGELKVISRTSVMAYASNRPNIREIAKALGVAAVVEGSVQRIGNHIRITVQLINATNDEHIWAENYEKEVTDVFAVQRDVAFEIASNLHAQLSPNERARIQQRPTKSGEAYLVYLQAQDALWRSQAMEEFEQIAQLYEKAIQLDPSFALALARLSYIESLMYHGTTSPPFLAKARAAANEALRLQPALPEGHLALGYIYYWGEGNYERALGEFDLAKAGLPNEADVLVAIGAIARRQGKWSESISHYEKASVLNPKDITIWTLGLGGDYVALRNFSAAAKAIDRGIPLDPNFFPGRLLRAYLEIASNGDLRAMEKFLAETPDNVDPDGQVTRARFELRIFQRKYDEALEVLARSPLDSFEGHVPGGDYPKSFLRARVYRLMKDDAKAHAFFEEAHRAIERGIRENPLSAARHALLGQVHAGLGRKDDSIREGKRAVELLPESKDALDGPLVSIALAEIYVMVGDNDAALPLLEHSLATPGGITAPLLKLDPVWDPLRSDPRFIQLLAEASGTIGPR